MKEFDRVMFVLQTGTCAAATDFTVLSGTASGTVSTNVTSITQLAATDDNVQAIVEVDASALGDSHRYIKGQIKTGGSNQFSCVALGGRARYHPASDGDLASVSEIVNA
jgi:hypothetical protein